MVYIFVLLGIAFFVVGLLQHETLLHIYMFFRIEMEKWKLRILEMEKWKLRILFHTYIVEWCLLAVEKGPLKG